MNTTWRRKKNSLAPENYIGVGAYLVAVATEGRARRLVDPGLVERCMSALDASAKAESIEVLAYVFMPDHAHLLVQGSETSSLPRFMKHFKQLTAFSFKRATGEVLWQKGYHDHVLRRDEDLSDVARYLAANPVRAGLVSGWKEYPFSGGRMLDEAVDGDLKVAATSPGANQGMAPI
jgi:putative transposase